MELTITLWSRCFYYPHFTDKESEVNLTKVTKTVRGNAGTRTYKNPVEEAPLLTTTLHILSKGTDDDGAANSKCSVASILIYLYSSSLRKSHPSHLQEETCTGQVWNLPKVKQPSQDGGKIQTQAVWPLNDSVLHSWKRLHDNIY